MCGLCETGYMARDEFDIGEPGDVELHVLIRKIWHRVKNKQERITFCDRSYEPTNELAFKELEVGLIVCPSCYNVEREAMQ